MVNIHADLRHAFKPPESGGTLESSVDGGFVLHACSRAIGKVKTLRVTPRLFFVSGAIVSFSSCVLKATSQTYDDDCFEHARLSLFTIRHRVSQSRADRWQHLGSQFASLIHHSWSFSKVLWDVGISRLSMFLSHPSTLNVWNIKWKHHLKKYFNLGTQILTWSDLSRWWFGGLPGWAVVWLLFFFRKATGKAQSRSPSPSPKKNASPKPSARPALRASGKKFHLTSLDLFTLGQEVLKKLIPSVPGIWGSLIFEVILGIFAPGVCSLQWAHWVVFFVFQTRFIQKITTRLEAKKMNTG